jgi:hypothetical protein
MIKPGFLIIILLSFSSILYSCASSDQKQESNTTFSHRVELHQPGDVTHEAAQTYIDSVARVTFKSREGLQITGSFSDGCTRLQDVTHTVINDSLTIQLSAWRNTDRMCTQALMPFSYFYHKLSPDQLNNFSTVTINDQTYAL